MNTETIIYINRLTEEIVKAYHVKIPILNMKNIVRMMGGCVKEDKEFDEFDDKPIKKNENGSFQITISKKKDKRYQNFEIARELGHIFLHMGFEINNEIWIRQDTSKPKQFTQCEQLYQANLFAESLLIPQDKAIHFLKENKMLDSYNVRELATYFHVPPSTAAARIQMLSPGVLREARDSYETEYEKE